MVGIDMCFNISVAKDSEFLEKRFGAKFVAPAPFGKVYHASAFAYPNLPVITNDRRGDIQLYTWGLIPRWTKDQATADKIRALTANARSDTLFDKASFKDSAEFRRCLVVADGFYEWQEVGGKKYPYHIRMPDGGAFAFAGIWDAWKDSGGNALDTFSIVTTDANPLMEKIHNTKRRMPVILKPEDEKKWLSNLNKDAAKALLKPYEGKLKAFTVSKLITEKGADNNVPAVMEPFDYKELKGEQAKLD